MFRVSAQGFGLELETPNVKLETVQRHMSLFSSLLRFPAFFDLQHGYRGATVRAHAQKLAAVTGKSIE